MSETSEKSLVKSGLFESIQDYRQRTGKSKGELNIHDYAPLIANALEAAGFTVMYVGTECMYHRSEESGELVEGGWGGLDKFSVSLRLTREDD